MVIYYFVCLFVCLDQCGHSCLRAFKDVDDFDYKAGKQKCNLISRQYGAVMRSITTGRKYITFSSLLICSESI